MQVTASSCGLLDSHRAGVCAVTRPSFCRHILSCSDSSNVFKLKEIEGFALMAEMFCVDCRG